VSPPPYAAPLDATDEVHAIAGDGGLDVVARKEISGTDRYLAAHFPGQVVYPGVFVLETVRQAVVAALGERDGRLPDLSAVRSVRFRSPLRPGDRLEVRATVGAPDAAGTLTVRARCRRGDGTEVARLVVEFRYGEPADA
jgi:3-hydroxyacyl-[acyl-carrier-protein] dehydratase